MTELTFRAQGLMNLGCSTGRLAYCRDAPEKFEASLQSNNSLEPLAVSFAARLVQSRSGVERLNLQMQAHLLDQRSADRTSVG